MDAADPRAALLAPQLAPPGLPAAVAPPSPDVEERIEWGDLEHDLRLELDPQEETELVNDVLNAIQAAEDGRRERMDTIKKVRERFYLRTPDREPPADWMANWHVPFTRWVLDGVNSRLWGNAFGQGKDTWVMVTGVRGMTDVDKAARAEPFLQYVNQTELRLDELYDEVIERVGTDGVVIIKVPWRRIVRKMRRRRLLEAQETMVDLETNLPILDAANRPKIRRVLRYAVDEQDEELYHGPRAELVTIDNFIVPNPNVSTIEGQPWCAQRFWLTRNQLWQDRERTVTLDGAEQTAGLYRNVEKIVSPRRREDSTSGHGMEAHMSAQEGVTTELVTPNLVGEVEAFEVIWPYRAWRQARDAHLSDAEAEKLPSRTILTIAAQEKVMLRSVRYEFWDPEPETMFVKVATIPKEGRFYNQSLGEILMPVQDELDTLHWQRTDATTVMILSFITFLAEEGAADQLKNLKLGAKNVVTQLDGIKLLADVVRIAIQVPGMDVEQLLLRFGELLSGISDIAAGVPARGEKTAFEIGSVLREGNLKYAKMIARLGDSVVKIDKIVLRRYAQFYPLVAPKVFRVKGGEADVVMELALDDLNFDPDLELRGASVSVNKELQAAKAFRVLQLAEQSMFFHGLLLSNPDGVYELVKTVLQQIDWPGGVEVLIGTKENALKKLGPILTVLATLRGLPGPGGNGQGAITTQKSPLAELLNAAGLTPELAALGGQANLGGVSPTGTEQ